MLIVVAVVPGPLNVHAPSASTVALPMTAPLSVEPWWIVIVLLSVEVAVPTTSHWFLLVMNLTLLVARVCRAPD